MVKLKLYTIYANDRFRKEIEYTRGAVHEMNLLGFNEDHSRDIAQKAAGPEKKVSLRKFKIKEPWKDSSLTICHELKFPGQLGSVLSQELF
jgi:hypothetical protein